MRVTVCGHIFRNVRMAVGTGNTLTISDAPMPKPISYPWSNGLVYIDLRHYAVVMEADLNDPHEDHWGKEQEQEL